MAGRYDDMRPYLLTSLLVAGLLLTACGPREGRAQDQSATRAQRRPGAAVEVSQPVDTTAPAVGDEPQAPPRPVHPAVAAAARAHIAELMQKFYTLERLTDDARTVLKSHRARTGATWSPEADPTDPWAPLILQRLLREAPANPFSPPDVATRVDVVRAPGATGETVSPKTAGWVWNSTDGMLYAARDSAAIRACRREDHRRTMREKVGPYLDPRLELLRAQISLYQLYETDDLWRPGEVADEQWDPLIRAGYLSLAPQNPMSPPHLSTTIVEVADKGVSGGAVDPQSAGWVWNSADDRLYAAGYDQ
jgi:hypothetical protein